MAEGILCFGGSFNPVHRGHMECAEAARVAGGFDRVLLIPAWRSPHKSGDADLAPAADRLAMCQLAAADYPQFAVSEIELRRSGVSFTIDTVRELKARGWSNLAWLIGADQLAALPRWHEADALVREVRFMIMARPGWAVDWDLLPHAFAALRKNVVDAPLIDVSATEIRRQVRVGGSIVPLVGEGVAAYIARRGLYQA